MDRPTFSQSWSRVSRLSPKLRPEVQITRQLFRSQPWHVVHDPVGNNFFRLNPVAYHLVGLFDGHRTVDEVWRLTLDRHGDAAPTQGEVIGLLSQLNQSNLLRIDLPPDAEPLLRRRNKRKFKHWGGQAMSVLFMRFPVFNPDRLLTWLSPFFRPILSKAGLVAWAAWLVFVLWQFLPESGRFLRDAHSVLSPSNWGWMILLFLGTKVCHELGHGLVCKRMGGLVPEVGIMLLVMFPVPYVDATSSWSFSDKWRRLLVGGAGMIFELALAGVGALVWLGAEPDSLARQLSYNVVFLASVATILFNANPLLRFDGYYMLSDLLEIPNLYQRAQRHMQWLIQRYGYGMTNAQPVSSRWGEQTLLLGYGICAFIYKILVLAGIVLFVAGKWFTLGLMLAAWSAFAWGLVPLSKFLHWLFTAPALHEHRARAVVVTTVFALVVGGGLGLIPADDHRRAVGVVEGADRADLAMGVDGFIQQVNAKAGSMVQAGQVILIADNPELRAREIEVRARLTRLRAARSKALADQMVDLKKVDAQLLASQDELADIRERLTALTLTSPITGTLIAGIMDQLVGRYVQRGQVIAQVVDMDSLRVTALVDQAENVALFDPVNPIDRVEVRVAGRLSEIQESSLIATPFPSGRSSLPHRSLGYAGGGQIATDPQDPEGQRTMHPQFELWLSLPDPAGDTRVYPGQRAYVRFTLENKRPLLTQWIHKLHQMLRRRLSV